MASTITRGAQTRVTLSATPSVCTEIVVPVGVRRLEIIALDSAGSVGVDSTIALSGTDGAAQVASAFPVFGGTCYVLDLDDRWSTGGSVYVASAVASAIVCIMPVSV